MKFKSSLTRSDHLLHFHYLNHKDFLTWPRETPEPSKGAVASQEWPIVDYSSPTTIPLSQCFLLTLQHWSQFLQAVCWENVEYSCSSRTVRSEKVETLLIQLPHKLSASFPTRSLIFRLPIRILLFFAWRILKVKARFKATWQPSELEGK